MVVIEQTLLLLEPSWRELSRERIEDVIQESGAQVARSSSEMENFMFTNAKTEDEYMTMLAKLTLYIWEMSQMQSSESASNEAFEN